MGLKIRQAEKELIRTLKGFRPNKRGVKRRINLLPFLGAIVGLVFGLMYVFSLRPESFSKTVPVVQGRLGALSPVVNFLVTALLMGIVVGKLLELSIRRLKKRF